MGKFSRHGRSVVEERSVDEKQQKSRNNGCQTPSRELGKAADDSGCGNRIVDDPNPEDLSLFKMRDRFVCETVLQVIWYWS